MGRVENVDDKIGATIAALAANKDEQKQKDLFGEFYQAYNQSRPLFQKAETTLMKIERLNEDISSSSVDEGMAA
jgi:methyl-accepting chemotaxis protein